MLVLHIRIGDEKLDRRRNRNEPGFERAAVDKQGMVLHATRGSVLIHDTAPHADIVVLSLLADLCGGQWNEWQPGGGQQRMSRADFQRGRGTEPCSDRNVGRNNEIGAHEANAALLEHYGHAEYVVRP